MMQQYRAIKDQVPDCLLLYRLGDFYEMFFEDALTASAVLQLTLTGRDCGLEERAPMCGVPYHAVDGYLQKLIDAGYKVAICEQLTAPTPGKGMIERGIVRIVTAGTALDDPQLPREKPLYLLCFHLQDKQLGWAAVDVSTGVFLCGQTDPPERMAELAARFGAGEIIGNREAVRLGRTLQEKGLMNLAVGLHNEWVFIGANAAKTLMEHFACKTLEGFGTDGVPLGEAAAGALMGYLRETQKNSLSHINTLKAENAAQGMAIDAMTRRHLELVSAEHGPTLFRVLNQTNTAMGARTLRDWLCGPLCDLAAINARQDAVAVLVDDHGRRGQLREALACVRDIQRLCARLSYGSFHARDAMALGESLAALPHVKARVGGCALLDEWCAAIDAFEEQAQLLTQCIHPEAPITLREGGLFAPGYDARLDDLRALADGGREQLDRLEEAERVETGIKTLKIGHNRVFGYYIEVTKSQTGAVPYRYTRKQTTANAERYVTEELLQLQEGISQAAQAGIAMEYEMFCRLREGLIAQIAKLTQTAQAIGLVDAIASLAEVAVMRGYVRPEMVAEPILDIRGGRHPVVESTLPPAGFAANDTTLGGEGRVMVLTGPNMAGKSTYIRQVALLCIMAQMGGFVPADSARMGLCDKLFTRIGASDDLAAGKSTFMVEMTEMAAILRNATDRSLVVLDEIGRGTATHDGLSIAWAAVEYLCQNLGCRTLFATHYHELTELQERLAGVVNYRVAVDEGAQGITFLHRIEPGGAQQSYGIHVAMLAGVPKDVIARAWQLLGLLREADITKAGDAQLPQASMPPPLVLAAPKSAALQKLREVDAMQLTPMQALQVLAQLAQEARDEE